MSGSRVAVLLVALLSVALGATVNCAGDVVIATDSSLASPCVCDSLTINAGVTVTSENVVLDILATSRVEIRAGAVLSNDAIATGGTGVGGAASGNQGGGGGGYGGLGGLSSLAGAQYGSFFRPYAPGSQGGASAASSGGLGGGLISIVAPVIDVRGTVQANGGTTTTTGAACYSCTKSGGGGSGGSIILNATTSIQGDGTLSVVGGSPPGSSFRGGGGSGGRLAVYAPASALPYSLTFLTTSGDGGELGGSGSAYVNVAGDEMLIFDAGQTTAAVPRTTLTVHDDPASNPPVVLTLGALHILGGANLYIRPLDSVNITATPIVATLPSRFDIDGTVVVPPSSSSIMFHSVMAGSLTWGTNLAVDGAVVDVQGELIGATGDLSLTESGSYQPTLSLQVTATNMGVPNRFNFSSLTVNAGATLNLPVTSDDAPTILAVSGTTAIGASTGAIATVTFSSLQAYFDDTVTINAMGVLSGDGGGNAGGAGFGAGTDAPGTGAGGGGGAFAGSAAAGGGSGGAGGRQYGNLYSPTEAGSGGGASGGSSGGAGGGMLWIRRATNIVHLGLISVNGGNSGPVVPSNCYNCKRSGGGGSGGSVFIQTDNVAGNGRITSTGGVGIAAAHRGGGGTGGRIALYTVTAPSFSLDLEAHPGLQSPASAAGSVYVNISSTAFEQLTFDGNFAQGTSTTVAGKNEITIHDEPILHPALFTRLSDLRVLNGARVVVRADDTLHVDNAIIANLPSRLDVLGTADLSASTDMDFHSTITGTLQWGDDLNVNGGTVDVSGTLVGATGALVLAVSGSFSPVLSLAGTATNVGEANRFNFTSVVVPPGATLNLPTTTDAAPTVLGVSGTTTIGAISGSQALVTFSSLHAHFGDTFTIREVGVLRGDGGGYGPGLGFGAGVDAPSSGMGGGGGGFAGFGGPGAGNVGSGGSQYGNLYAPVEAGSGGGASGGSSGGNGGGLLRILHAPSIVHFGLISVDGGDSGPVVASTCYNCKRSGGGGSGGSVFIQTDNVAGNGRISSVGGVGQGASHRGGSGSGGRIALYTVTAPSFSLDLDAHPGLSAGAGAAGSVYVNISSTAFEQLTFDGNFAEGTSTTVAGKNEITIHDEPVLHPAMFTRLSDLRVLNGARVVVRADDILHVVNAIIANLPSRLDVLGTADLSASTDMDFHSTISGTLQWGDDLNVNGGLLDVAGTLEGTHGAWQLTTAGTSVTLQGTGTNTGAANEYAFASLDMEPGTTVTLGNAPASPMKITVAGDVQVGDAAGSLARIFGTTLHLTVGGAFNLALQGEVVFTDVGGSLIGNGEDVSSTSMGGNGGGHAGWGGRGRDNNAATGAQFASWYRPVRVGGTGGATGGSVGGKGGGVFWVRADSAVVDGVIDVSGGAGGPSVSASCYNCRRSGGGGAGGSVLIEVDRLSGAGHVRANGNEAQSANFRGGGGSGGRMAVHARTTFDPYTITYTAHAGAGASGGAAGSIYLNISTRVPSEELIYDAGAVVGATVTMDGINYLNNYDLPDDELPVFIAVERLKVFGGAYIKVREFDSFLLSDAVDADLPSRIDVAGTFDALATTHVNFHFRVHVGGVLTLGADVRIRGATVDIEGLLDTRGSLYAEKVITTASFQPTITLYDTGANAGSAGPGVYDFDGDITLMEATTLVLQMPLPTSDSEAMKLKAGGDFYIRSWTGESASVQGSWFTLAADGTMTVDANCLIEADFKGFAAGFGPGEAAGVAPGTNQGGHGGSHGTKGEAGANQDPSTIGATYGSMTWPTLPGSVGQQAGSCSVPAGGGAIHLEARYLVLNGDVSADGASSSICSTTACYNCKRSSGGGSGGAILVATEAFSGSGTLSAVGGAATPTSFTGGAGACGRIGLFAESNYSFTGSSDTCAPFTNSNGTLFCFPDCEHGVCEIDNGSGEATCACEAGYEGEACKDPIIFPCPNKNCGGNGVCNNVTRECNCTLGFSGPGCEVESPCPLGCSNRGVCLPSTGECYCVLGFEGEGCERVNACPGACSGNGICNVRTKKCTCQPGWTGGACQTASPCPYGCFNQGACNASSGECTCYEGFGGEDCAIDTTCDPLPKLDYGTIECTGTDHGSVCNATCQPGFEVVGPASRTCTDGMWSDEGLLTECAATTACSPFDSCAACTSTAAVNAGCNWCASSSLCVPVSTPCSSATSECPAVLTATPNTGAVEGGTRVTIAGSGFVPYDEDGIALTYACRFGTSALTPATYNSSSEVVCSSPPSDSAKNVPVEVYANGLLYSKATTASFTYYSCTLPAETVFPCTQCLVDTKPECGYCADTNTCQSRLGSAASCIESASQCPFIVNLAEARSSPLEGGTEVVIAGQNLPAGRDGVVVNFGTVATVPVLAITTTEILVVAPPSYVTGRVVLTVATEDSSGALIATGSVDFTYYNCSDVPLTTENEHPCIECHNAERQGCGWCLATQECSGRVASCASEYATSVCPAMDSLEPSQGGIDGGETIVVTGVKFTDVIPLTCEFGSSVAPATFVSDTELSCVSPPGNGQTTVRILTESNDQYTVNVNQYFYASPSGIVETDNTTDSAASDPVMLSILSMFCCIICLLIGILIGIVMRKRNKEKRFKKKFMGAADGDVTVAYDSNFMSEYIRACLAENRCEVLGTGGSATVYQIEMPTSGENVAMKLLTKKTMDDLDEFHGELAILRLCESKLSHPHIVSLAFCCEDPAHELYAIGLTLCQKSLLAYLQDKTRSDAERLELVVQAASAIEFLHAIRVAHLDIKPRNILITAAGTAVLTDFGTAQTLTSAGESLNADTYLVGTPQYMAPERIRDDKGCNLTLADVYAFGITLWGVWEVDEPYRSVRGNVVMSHVRKDPAYRPPVSDDCHSCVKSLMTACWSHEPANRPPMSKVVADLCECLSKCFNTFFDPPRANLDTLSSFPSSVSLDMDDGNTIKVERENPLFNADTMHSATGLGSFNAAYASAVAGQEGTPAQSAAQEHAILPSSPALPTAVPPSSNHSVGPSVYPAPPPTMAPATENASFQPGFGTAEFDGLESTAFASNMYASEASLASMTPPPPPPQ